MKPRTTKEIISSPDEYGYVQQCYDYFFRAASGARPKPPTMAVATTQTVQSDWIAVAGWHR